MQNLISARAFLIVSTLLVVPAFVLAGCGSGSQQAEFYQADQATQDAMLTAIPGPAGSDRSIYQDQNATQVVINGTALDQQQLNAIKSAYGIEPLPGHYWYDSMSGLYGVVGYQAYGFMLPGHSFGPLSRTASNGTSGVIVNGRELQMAEVQLLSRIRGAQVQQGSYWLDSNGNAGNEGSPVPLGNLFVAAAQNGYTGNSSQASGGTSGDNFWSTAFSAGNSDRGGTRGYVSVPGYGPVGYGF
ncbi:MAG: hypothetical protein AAF456_02925 [Planctomycetota bacterium]